jgi:hypothetical protein
MVFTKDCVGEGKWRRGRPRSRLLVVPAIPAVVIVPVVASASTIVAVLASFATEEQIGDCEESRHDDLLFIDLPAPVAGCPYSAGRSSRLHPPTG